MSDFNLLNDVILGLNEFIERLNRHPMGKQLSLFPAARNEQTQFLPEWYHDIDDLRVREKVLNKLKSAYHSYARSRGDDVSMKDFISRYSEHLIRNGYLYHYCSYHDKPIDVSDDGKCQELYCTRKPDDNICRFAKLKFGKE